MTYELIVNPQVVHTIGDDVEAIGRSMRLARDHLDSHVKSSVTGGFWIFDAGEMIDNIRSDLVAQYDEYPTQTIGGGERINELATIYVRTDRDQWHKYDQMNRHGIANLDGEVTPIPSANDTYELDHLTGNDATSGFSRADAKALLPEPSAYDSGIRGVWVDVSTKIDELLSLGDQVRDVVVLGLPNPFDGWLEKWEGNWEEIGVSAEAIDSLGRYWRRAGEEALATQHLFEGNWEGLAANNVAYWLSSLARNAWDHGEGMISVAGEIESKGALLYATLLPLVEAAQDIVDILYTALILAESVGDPKQLWQILSDPLGFLGDKWDDAKKLADLIKQIGGFLGKVDKYASIAIAAIEAVVSIYEELDTETYQLFDFWTGRGLGRVTVGE